MLLLLSFFLLLFLYINGYVMFRFVRCVRKKFLSLGLWSTSLTVLIVRFLYVCNMCVFVCVWIKHNIKIKVDEISIFLFFIIIMVHDIFFLGYSKHIHKSNVIITNGRPRPFCDLFFFSRTPFIHPNDDNHHLEVNWLPDWILTIVNKYMNLS